jgi:hypothetical protein
MKVMLAHTILFESSGLNGLTGDSGEKFCLFVRDNFNPLSSGWKWFQTRQEALDFNAKLEKDNPKMNQWVLY